MHEHFSTQQPRRPYTLQADAGSGAARPPSQTASGPYVRTSGFRSQEHRWASAESCIIDPYRLPARGSGAA